MNRQHVTGGGHGLLALRRNQVGLQAAEAFEDLDCGILVFRGEAAAEQNMAVENGARAIADRIVPVVAFGQHGVKAGNRAVFVAARLLEHHGQKAEDRWRITARRRRFADGEAHFALRHGQAGEGIHEQEHMLALIAKMGGDGVGGEGRLDADKRRLIRRGHDDHAAFERFGTEVLLDELEDFTTAFADQRDDVDFGGAVAADHAKETAFPHAAAGEDAETLAAPAGGKGVHHAHAGGQGFADASTTGRIRDLAHDVLFGMVRGQRAQVVQRAAEGIENAAQDFLADRHLQGTAGGSHGGADGNSLELFPGHQQHAAIAETDDFGERFLAAARRDRAGFAEGGGWSLRLDGEPHHLGDAAHRARAVQPLKAFLVTIEHLAGHDEPSSAR